MVAHLNYTDTTKFIFKLQFPEWWVLQPSRIVLQQKIHQQPSIDDTVPCADRQKVIDSFKLRTLQQLHIHSLQLIPEMCDSIKKNTVIAARLPDKGVF